MRCPKCGNEVGQEEAFCGQCGTPNMLPAQPTEAVNTPAPRSGLLRSYGTKVVPPSSPYNTNSTPPSSPYQPGTMPPPSNFYNVGTPPPVLPTRPLTSGPASGQPQFPPGPSGPQQPTDFYQDATEAITSLPSPQNYPQQNFPGTPMQGGYPGMGSYGPPGTYGPQMQPFQAGNYAGSAYPPAQTLGQGYGYGMQPNGAPRRKDRNNSILIIACIFLVVAILIATGVGILYLQRSQSAPATSAPTSVPTATAIPSPIPSPTATATPTPIPTPSPTVAPSPTPDPGFAFCDQSCTTNGFSVEYPSNWRQGTTSDNIGVKFINPTAQDEYAAFKVAGSTHANANTLVNTDLENNFASKPGYVAPTSSQSTTIGGVTWVYEVATFTLNSQKERIQVYATVRQGKSYIIELEAADNQFDTINTKYFETMLGNFQFV